MGVSPRMWGDLALLCGLLLHTGTGQPQGEGRAIDSLGPLPHSSRVFLPLPSFENSLPRGHPLDAQDVVPLNFTECRSAEPNENTSLQDFTVENMDKTENISLASYQGKILLVVNVATF